MMEVFKRVIGSYIDLGNIQLSKTNFAAGVGAIVLGTLLWDELKAYHS
jgi:hypothetical protein